jgi:tetratricopeptide (TPR) repeat protein
MIRRKPLVLCAVAFVVLALLGTAWILTHRDGGREEARHEEPRGDKPGAVPSPRTDPLIVALNRAAQGDLDGALAEIEVLHEAQPDAPGPYLGLAEIAVRKGDPQAAEAWLSKGIGVAPNVSEFYRARARLFLLQKREDEALAAFDTAMALAPNEARVRIEVADLYATRLNQPAKSVDYFKAALALEPGNAVAHYGLGVALARTDRAEEAKATLAEAQKLAPSNPMPSVAIGQIYAQERRYPEALEAFDAALAIQPTLTIARIARGDLLRGTQKYSEAIEEYRLALGTNPKSQLALFGLAMTQQAAGFEGDAEKSYREVIALDPNQPLALNNLAWLVSEQKGNLDDALGWAKKAIELQPGQAAFHDTLGWVYYQRRELAEASESFERSVQLQPAALTYTHLGTVRVALGDKNAAAEAFRKALAIAPTYQPAIDGLTAVQ